MTGWAILVYVCTAAPLALLFVLTVPLPRSVRRTVLAATKHVIFLKIGISRQRSLGWSAMCVVGGLQAIHLMLLVSAAAFVDQSFRTAELRGRERPIMETDRTILKGKIWRSERNFWIACFCFFVWWMLSAYYRTLIRLLEAKDENEQLKKQIASAAPQQSPGDKKND